MRFFKEFMPKQKFFKNLAKNFVKKPCVIVNFLVYLEQGEKFMSFCKFSSQINSQNFTIVENKFIEEYLPFASGEQVRIYVWGLYLCYNNNVLKNELSSLESFSADLGISQEEVLNAFRFWEEQGLVQIVETQPFEVQYLPVKSAIAKQKFKPNKYEQFNLQIQTILSGRMLTPNEFSEYYALLENYHMAPEALLMIAGYCAENKGNNVGYSYILTVAKNWANEGILSLIQVEDKLKEISGVGASLKEVFKALGTSRQPTLEERQQYIKWTKDFGFDKEVVVFVAKNLKKASFEKLASRMAKYYELRLISAREIEEYETHKTELFDLAKEINKIIGVYYENLENIVETYTNPWIMRGYGEDALKAIANYCFKNGIRTLQGMDGVVQKFYKNGLTTIDAIAQHILQAKAQDEQIKKVLEKANLQRIVTSWDRDSYKTWVYSWNMPQEVIEYAATLSADKSQPMQYINKILSNWFDQKIFSLEQAKLAGDLFKNGVGVDSKKDQGVIKSREYTQEEIQALVGDIGEIEL